MTHTDQCARMRPVRTNDPVGFNPYYCYRRLQWAGLVARTRWTGYNVVTVIAGPKTHLYMTPREFSDLVMEVLAPLAPRLLNTGNWTVDITTDTPPARCQPTTQRVRQDGYRRVHTTRKEI